MIEEIIYKIENQEKFDLNETFEIYKLCSEYILQDELLAQRIIVNILDNKIKFDINLEPILTDLIEAIGFYPYLTKEKLELISTDSLIRQNYHHSENLNKFLHEDQKHLLNLLNTDKNIIVSAPTSFGKSLLIEEFVASKKFKNIIIIQPTLALLDETRKKLKKYDETYKIIVRTSQESSLEKGNIYLFTAERVNEYKNLPHIDFIIIDEFYKLSAKRDDERSDSLNNAFNYIVKTFNSKFYLLGPNIDGISKGFVEKYNAIFYKTKSSLVDSKVIDIYSEHKDFFDRPKKHKEYKENILFELLLQNKNEQSIIYCSSPSRVRYLSSKFNSFLEEKNEINNDIELDIIEWIKINVSKEWSLIKLLNNKIGIHDGALQKHITTSTIEYFNEQKINYLFCTTTIIEGVNTSAKNIVYFDSTKGNQTPIDYFDYSNIKGRAGRLMIHYTGKIYNFNKIPKNVLTIVDIPFFEQNPISNEILINLEREEVNENNLEQFASINNIPKQERELIKQNGVQVYGQKNIIETLRNDIKTKYHLICWNRIPKKEQLYYILELAWNNLLKPGESVRPMTLKGLVTVTQIYGYNQSIWNVIDNNYNYFKTLPQFQELNDNEIKDEAIRQSFQTLKHWLEYKVPKWLSVMNTLQEFVCTEKGLRSGNYAYFSNLIENDFLRDNLSILAEYGIPSSAIRKLEKLISDNVPQDSVLKIIKDKKLYDNSVFIEYERKKLNEN
jgi:late competence protein required for DNA uptake (superfamily II DNA/RNA helicase)